jgi:hypothetical protein
VYRAAQDVSYAVELYSVPSDGSAPAVELNPPLVNQGHVGNFALAPEGGLVVFDAQVAIPGVVEVWSVPSDGSAPAARLHPALAGEADASLHAITPDGAYVLYLGDVGLSGPFDLYTVPIDGSAAPQRLNESFEQGQGITGMALAPDGERVLYLADQERNDVFELFSARTDGVPPAVRTSGLLVPGGDVVAPITITPDGRHVLFLADAAADEVFELFVTPLRGGHLPIRVHPPLVAPRSVRRASSTPGF